MMKSTWFSAVLLVVPGVAAAAMEMLLLSNVEYLRAVFVVMLVVAPLRMATPVASALGIAFAVYAMCRGKRRVFPLLLVVIHTVCFAGAAKLWIEWYQEEQVERRASEAREHAYLLSLTPDQQLIDIVSRRREPTDIPILLSNGVDPNIRGPNGTPAISLLVQRRDGLVWSHVMCDLLSAGADPNATDRRGWTALHHAGVLYKEHYVAELLAHGADHAALTDRGESAMSLVREKGRRVGGPSDEIIAILLVEASGASKAELQELEAKLLSNKDAKALWSLMPSKRFRHFGHGARK